MLNRLFAIAFLSSILFAPFAGLASMVGANPFSQAEAQQKSLCLVAGVGCGSGHVLLPALVRY